MIRYYLILLCMLFTIGLHEQESPNSRQARRMFNEAYQKVYGPLTIEYPCNKWRWLEEPWPWEGGIV